MRCRLPLTNCWLFGATHPSLVDNGQAVFLAFDAEATARINCRRWQFEVLGQRRACALAGRPSLGWTSWRLVSKEQANSDRAAPEQLSP